MKKNKEVYESGIRLKGEDNNIRGGMSKGNVILIGIVCLLVGFILGATVVILKTQPRVAPTPAPMVGPTVKESGKNRSATDYQEEIRHPEVERK